ncbi:hypothetical protein [Streptacidiphilus sp. EB103A]|uniref:hypothetical protein n=1 Tax=Streptacidiphilus sp. EB103A TaxID=3156275 RepID=UPI00351552D8
MGFPIANTIYTISAVASAIAAGASWRTAQRANAAADRANEAAEKANLTADTLAAIERDRRHSELRPQLDISRVPRQGSTQELLHFMFKGPNELEPHGPLNVTITVRDDRDRSHDRILPGGPTREEVAAQVWGPWRLAPGADGVDPLGRSFANQLVAVGEKLVCAIEKTTPPAWDANDAERWWRKYRPTPLRFRVEVTCEGFEPWVFLEEIPSWSSPGIGRAGSGQVGDPARGIG